MLQKQIKLPLLTMVSFSMTFFAVNITDIVYSADQIKQSKVPSRSLSEPHSMREKPSIFVPNTLSKSSPGKIDGKIVASEPMLIPTPKKPIKQGNKEQNCHQNGNFHYGDYPQFIDLYPMSIEELEKYKSDLQRNEQAPSHINIPPRSSVNNTALVQYYPSTTEQKYTRYNQNDNFY